MTSHAMFGGETMMAEISPSWRCINGPYFVARSRRARCGSELESKLFKLPMMGNFLEPGGSFFLGTNVVPNRP